MNSIRILQTSDLYIDHVFSDYDKMIRKERRAEVMESFEYIMDLAISQNVDALCIAGDLVCVASAAKDAFLRIKEGFKKVASHGIHIVGVLGERDGLSNKEIMRDTYAGDRIHLFDKNEWSVYTGLDGVAFFGISPDENDLKKTFLRQTKFDYNGLKIGLMHGAFNSSSHFFDDICPLSSTDIDSSGLDYLALGHYKNMVNCSSGMTTSWYSGSPVHHSFDTRGERHVLIVDIEKNAVKVRPMKIPCKLQRVLNMDVTGKSFEDIREHLLKLASLQTYMRLELSGIWSISLEPLMVQLKESLKDSFMYIDIKDKTAVHLGRELFSQDRSFRRKNSQNHGENFVGKMAKFKSANEVQSYTDDLIKIRASKLGLAALGEVYENEIREIECNIG